MNESLIMQSTKEANKKKKIPIEWLMKSKEEKKMIIPINQITQSGKERERKYMKIIINFSWYG